MFINKIKFSLKLNGRKFSTHNLIHLFTNNHGWSTYSFGRKKNLHLRYYEREDIIKISGSLPCFLNGHSFYSNHEVTKKAIASISEVIDLDISGAIIEVFDFGTVIQTEASPSSVFQNHVSLDDYSIRKFKNGKSFSDPEMMIRLYDAKETLLPRVKKEIQDQWRQKDIYDPSLSAIKFEVRYKTPALYFTIPITIDDIIDDNFNDILIRDLEDQYSRIKVKIEDLIPIEEGHKTIKEYQYILSKNEASTQKHAKKITEELMNILCNLDSIILN